MSKVRYNENDNFTIREKRRFRKAKRRAEHRNKKSKNLNLAKYSYLSGYYLIDEMPIYQKITTFTPEHTEKVPIYDDIFHVYYNTKTKKYERKVYHRLKGYETVTIPESVHSYSRQIDTKHIKPYLKKWNCSKSKKFAKKTSDSVLRNKEDICYKGSQYKKLYNFYFNVF